ncbi:hypothetical protein HPB51_006020 [Rhipicephalus microplus]|uniref:Peptidase A2 domain-containing protein n=1 Tax=Rhipicephalus microplus TaxID=6941 RepID=A0A9J6EFN3_RHIMP|nr:hypothetical protein HPB51_006020 [Rhipicephalus microplus]
MPAATAAHLQSLCPASNMNSTIPPPVFLQCSGVPPMPWMKWCRVLEVYNDVAAPEATSERKDVCRLQGLDVYYKAANEHAQLDGVQPTGMVSCGKQENFSKMCRSSDDSASAPDGEEGQGRAVTNAITILSVQGAVNGVQLMRVPVPMNGVQTKLLIDTGAVVSLLSIHDYQKNFSQVKLQKSHFTIHNQSEKGMGNLDFFQASVQYQGKSVPVKLFVTEKSTSLLGLDAIQALQLVIIGKILTCTAVQPDPRRIQESAHQRNRRPDHEDLTKIQQRSFRLPKEVTNDLAWLKETGILKREIPVDKFLRNGIPAVPVALVPSDDDFV